MRSEILLLLAGLTFVQAAQADELNQKPPATKNMARILAGLAPQHSALIRQLNPWLAEVTQKIKLHPSFGKLEKAANQSLSENTTVICTFSLSPDCHIINFHLQKPSQSSELNSQICALFQDFPPISRPANSLPNEGGVLVEFFIDHQHLEVAVLPKLEVGIFPLKATRADKSETK